MTPLLAGVPPLPSTSVPVPHLRRIPVPLTEPPYDDELASPVGDVEHGSFDVRLVGPLLAGHGPEPGFAVQGMLALTFAAASPRPVAPLGPPSQPPLRLVPALPVDPDADPGGDENDEGDADPPWRRTPTRELPPARHWAGQLLQSVLEVLAGSRSPGQVRRHLAESVYVDILGKVTARSTGGPPTGRVPGGPTVCSVQVSSPVDGVAEAFAVIKRGVRFRAAALRLEGRNGRWQCTVLRIG